MEEKIKNMNREELIDFLVENWTDLVRHLPSGEERDFFNSGSPLQKTENLRMMALSLIDQ